MTRPPFASDQVELTSAGQVRFELKRPRSSGQTHLLLEPEAFLRRLAWLIPPQRVHLLRYHGRHASLCILFSNSGQAERIFVIENADVSRATVGDVLDTDSDGLTLQIGG